MTTTTKHASSLVEIQGDVLTPEQLCVLAQLSYDTLALHRRKGTGPKELRIGNAVRFLRSDVMSWLETLRAPTPAG
jgi:predicted DNA-binding transcriptional regulator AlpA